MSQPLGYTLKLDLNEALIRQVAKNGSKKAAWSACDVLASASKEQVPLDTGALKNSCAVSASDDGMQGCVSYDTPYAVIQHEVTTFQHQRGRKAKYLEDPAFDGGVQGRMAQAAKSAFESEIG